MVSDELDLLIDKLPSAKVYLISGPTGAGKTTFAKKLSRMRNAKILSMDNYFFDSDEIPIEHSKKYGSALQWDNPISFNLPLLKENIKELIFNNRSCIPIFCFKKNKRIGMKHLIKGENQPVIVEGIFSAMCYDFLINLDIIVLSIFITADEKIRSDRVKHRDLKERNRSLTSFKKRWHFIRKAEERWIKNQINTAGIIIDTSKIYYKLQFC